MFGNRFSSLSKALQTIEKEILRLKKVERVDGESAASASSYDLDVMFSDLGRLYYRLAMTEER